MVGVISIHEAKGTIVNGDSNDAHVVRIQHPCTERNDITDQWMRLVCECVMTFRVLDNLVRIMKCVWYVMACDNLGDIRVM